MSKLKDIIFYLYCFLFFLTFNEGVIRLKFADEIFLLISTVILFVFMFYNLNKFKISKIIFIFALYIIYQFVNSGLSPFGYNWIYVFLQSLINIKTFIVSLAVLLIFKNSRSNFKLIHNILIVYISLFVFGLLSNLVFAESWNNFVGYVVRYRYGIIRPAGWFVSPGQNSYFFATTFTTLLLLRNKEIIINKTKMIKSFVVLSFFSFLFMFWFTVRKGMMVIIPFGGAILKRVNFRNRVYFSILSCLFLFLFIFALKDTQIIEDTLGNYRDFTHGDHAYTRGLMVYHGFFLFLELFPFGSGSATFGTILSQDNTLEVYKYVGMPEYTYSGEELIGLYDIGLFSVMAENGFFGVLLIGFFIYYFFKFNKKRLDPYNYMVFNVLTWFSILLSITEPVFQNGMFTVFYVTNLLFIYTKNNIYKNINGLTHKL